MLRVLLYDLRKGLLLHVSFPPFFRHVNPSKGKREFEASLISREFQDTLGC